MQASTSPNQLDITTQDAQQNNVPDLPDWMLQARRGVNWGLLLVLALSIAGAWPFWVQDSLPRTNDNERYVFRVADTTQALQEGRLYPRWSPYALGGYGAPIPHYEPPAAPYLGALISLLLTNDPMQAVRLLYIGALMLCAVMLYTFVQHRVGSSAGVLSALLFVYSPYIGLTAPHLLGDLPAMLALALLIGLLWSLDRVMMRNLPLDFALLVVFVAALLLAEPRHFLAGIALSALLASYDAVRLHRFSRLLTVMAAFALALLLSAFYWLPAWLEAGLVRWQPPALVAASHSLTLADLLQPATQVDPAALRPAPQFTLGTAIILFSGLSAISLLWSRRINLQFWALLSGIACAVLTLVYLPRETWLLGIMTLCFAIGGGGVLASVETLNARWQRVSFTGLILGAFLLAIPVWLGPVVAENWDDISPAAQIRFEQQGFGVATLPQGHAVPTTLAPELAVNRALAANSQDDKSKLNRFGLDERQRNQAVVLESASHTMRYQVRSVATTDITLLLAYFPGWRAMLNTKPLPLYRDSSNGLARVDLPSSIRENELVISLDSTPIRRIAWALSSTALLLLGGFMLWRLRRLKGVHHDDSPMLSLQVTRLMALLLLAFALILVVDTPISPGALRAEAQYQLRDALRLGYRTDVGLEIIAFEVNSTAITPGDTLDLTLYWQALRFLPESIQVRVRLQDIATYSTPLQTDLRHPGHYPTRRWPRNRYLPDTYNLALPENLAAGRYVLTVEALRCDPQCTTNLTYFDGDGRSLGALLTLPQIITVHAT